MKRLTFLVCFLFCSVSFGADVDLTTVSVSDKGNPKFMAMVNERCPKIEGETNAEQVQRFIKELILREFSIYEHGVAQQVARDSVVISTDTVKIKDK